MPDLVGAGISGNVIRQPLVNVEIITKDKETGQSVVGSGPIATGYSSLIIADGSIAYYRLGESSGIVANDEIGPNNNDGTYISNPTLGENSLLISDPDNKSILLPGGVAYMDGGDDNIFTFNNGVSDTPFSIECWVTTTASGAIGSIVSKTETTSLGGSNNEWSLHIDGAGLLSAFLYSGVTGSSHSWKENIASIIGVSNTYHIVATYDGSVNSGKFYVNGASVAVTPGNNGSYTGMPNTNSTLKLGVVFLNNISFERLGDGHRDELSIWDKVLTPSQVLAHYNAGI